MNSVILWMLLAAPAAQGQGAAPLSHYEAVSTPLPPADGDAADVRMAADAHRRMTVPVRLGVAGPYQFLVDTGSDRTSVSREVALKLGLAERPRALLHSATGASSVRMAWLPEISMSHRSVRNISAPMLDAADMGADGILGIDSLRAQRVVFDFARGRLSILSAKTMAAVDEDAIIVRAKRRQGRLVVTDAEVAGERVNVVLDSGSALTLGNLALRRRLARRGDLTTIGPIDLISVTGASLRGELARVASLDIGGARLEGLQVVFADAHTFGELGLGKRPAILLGMNAMRGFDQVTIDFAERSLSLVLPKGRKQARS